MHRIKHHIKKHHKKYLFGIFGGRAIFKTMLLILGLFGVVNVELDNNKTYAEDCVVATGYVQIMSCQDLQDISNDLGGDYALCRDIDCSGISNFDPIGDDIASFAGNFDGQGYLVTGLTINRPTEDYVGLFGIINTAGSISDINIIGSVIGRDYVGLLVGENNSQISGSTAQGTVQGNNRIGGLVGHNYNLITTSSFSGSVVGNTWVGGLVGVNDGTIESSSVIGGSVIGVDSVGGLAGLSRGTIKSSSTVVSPQVNGANGNKFGNLVGEIGGGVILNNNTFPISINVSTADNVGCLAGKSSIPLSGWNIEVNVIGKGYVGGLIGGSVGVISNVNIEGTVQGSYGIGGLVGHSTQSITTSSFSGSVVGNTWVGGLVGINDDLIESSSVIGGSVIGVDSVGGLAGYSRGTIISSSTVVSPQVNGANGNKFGNLVGEIGGGVILNNNTFPISINVSTADNVGCLAGKSSIPLSGWNIEVNVIGKNYVGGLIGWSIGAISNVNIEGTVSGVSVVGAIVGTNDSTINNSTADVVTSSDTFVGQNAGVCNDTDWNLGGPYSPCTVETATCECVAPPVPIAEYKFDSCFGTSAIDNIGNNTGTIYGAIGAAGYSNYGLEFQGSDYVLVNNINIGGNLTFAAWIKSNNYTDDILMSISKGPYGLNIYFNGGKISWNQGDGSTNAFLNSSYPDNGWHYIVVVNDSGNDVTKLYMDGVFVGTASYVDSTIVNGSIGLGSRTAYNMSLGHSGYIDEVRIYDEVLSSSDILDLYNSYGSYGGIECDIKSYIVGYEEESDWLNVSLERYRFTNLRKTLGLTLNEAYNTVFNINNNLGRATSGDRLMTPFGFRAPVPDLISSGENVTVELKVKFFNLNGE